jgi:hypothetical protein
MNALVKSILRALKECPRVEARVTRVARPEVDCPEEYVAGLGATVQYRAVLEGQPLLITFSGSHLKDYAQEFQVACSIVRLMYQHADPMPFVGHVLFSPARKMLPQRGVVLGKPEINSGYCYPERELVVYREEEWVRTFSHECMHYFKLDALLDGVKFKYPWVRLAESHCEVWARLITCCLCALRQKMAVPRVLQFERLFSCYQLLKVLDHMGLAYADILHGRMQRYQEKTNVYAYMVITAVLLNTPDYFLRCKEDNPKFLNASLAMPALFETLQWKLVPALSRIEAQFARDKLLNDDWYRTLAFTSTDRN